MLDGVNIFAKVHLRLMLVVYLEVMQEEETIPRVFTGGGKVLLWVVERNEPMAVSLFLFSLLFSC